MTGRHCSCCGARGCGWGVSKRHRLLCCRVLVLQTRATPKLSTGPLAIHRRLRPGIATATASTAALNCTCSAAAAVGTRTAFVACRGIVPLGPGVFALELLGALCKHSSLCTRGMRCGVALSA